MPTDKIDPVEAESTDDIVDSTPPASVKSDDEKKEAIHKVMDAIKTMGLEDADPNKTPTPLETKEEVPTIDAAPNKPVSRLKQTGKLNPTGKLIPPDELKSPDELQSAKEEVKSEESTSEKSVPENISPAVEQGVSLDISTQIVPREDQPLAVKTPEPPWALQQFFNGEVDLDVELTKRFPNMPMMSSIKFRSLGSKSGHQVATLATQDGHASVVIDADETTKEVQLAFTFGSMITLRFNLADLSNGDRSRWVELMRRRQGGLAFLWGPTRWADDYLICITRKYFSNIYAFSPNNFEAGVRLTPEVTQKLLDWMDEIWKAPPKDDAPPQLLTW